MFDKFMSSNDPDVDLSNVDLSVYLAYYGDFSQIPHLEDTSDVDVHFAPPNHPQKPLEDIPTASMISI